MPACQIDIHAVTHPSNCNISRYMYQLKLDYQKCSFAELNKRFSVCPYHPYRISSLLKFLGGDEKCLTIVERFHSFTRSSSELYECLHVLIGTHDI